MDQEKRKQDIGIIKMINGNFIHGVSCANVKSGEINIIHLTLEIQNDSKNKQEEETKTQNLGSIKINGLEINTKGANIVQ